MLAFWLSLALPYDQFWTLTIREASLIMDGIAESRTNEHERERVLLYEAANLTSFAYHDPKKIPKYKPISAKPQERDLKSDAEVRATLKAIAAMRSK